MDINYSSHNRSLRSLFLKPKIVIVGTGLFGLTIAEQIASKLNLEVLMIDRRNHIGGNAWSEIHAQSGIEVHKYGSHLFHTSHEEVWKYVNQFTEFNEYQHHVWTKHRSEVFSLPINLSTISQFYGKLLSPQEAMDLISSEVQSTSLSNNSNFENLAISTIGKPLYEAFIKGYTQKQWQVEPSKLPGEIFSRLPVRYNFNNRYFNDTHEGLPLNGYNHFLPKIVDNKLIKVEVETDYFKNRDRFADADLTIYTGAIDKYFDYKHGLLGWRTLDFEIEYLKIKDFQGTSVMNYADLEVPFTRIHEFQHLHPERTKKETGTVIMREFSRKSEIGDEPYYPINSREDRISLLKYRDEAQRIPNVIFGGRLGTYKYLDMHMAIASALQVFETQIEHRFA
jgi:UDP-galactopyranose mutase